MSENPTYTERTAPFKFERADNGFLVGMDGCHYTNEADAFYYGQLKLCGCGNPDQVHKLLLDCAKCFATSPSHENIENIEKIIKDNTGVVAEFIAHFLDDKELTEHGGSVYGSWLTGRGKQFIDAGILKDE